MSRGGTEGGSFEFVQVKFTVDPDRYELDWGWLLGKTRNGTSMLEKWAKSLAPVAAMGPIHSAGLKTNRMPSAEFPKFLKGTRVDLDLLPEGVRDSVESACGGQPRPRRSSEPSNSWEGCRISTGRKTVYAISSCLPTRIAGLAGLRTPCGVGDFITSQSPMEEFCGRMSSTSSRSAAPSRSGRTLSFPMATARQRGLRQIHS